LIQLVRIYRSSRTEGMYLYVDVDRDLDAVPEMLLARFGRPIEAMELELTPQRKLARASAAEVMARITEEGYYLQMPPAVGEPEASGR
jgi:uncharacterized protein YcgL (UPF0745 family)